MRLAVRDIVGEYAMTQQDGQKVYERIAPAIQSGQPVEVDFAGVTIFAAPFFNAAIGQFLRNNKAEAPRRLLTPFNLPPAGESVLRQVIDNATRYFAAFEEHREAQWRVVQATAEEE